MSIFRLLVAYVQPWDGSWREFEFCVHRIWMRVFQMQEAFADFLARRKSKPVA